MGHAALEYFESGGDVRGLAEKVRDARDRALAAARRTTTRKPEPPLPAHAWVAEEITLAGPTTSLPSTGRATEPRADESGPL
jgi:hypothetical protein